MLPQPGGVSHVQQTKTGWKHFCVGLLSLATVQPLHPPLPKSVPPQMIDYSTALPETPDTYFTLSYLPAVMNITTSDVTPTTTYSSQSGQPH